MSSVRSAKYLTKQPQPFFTMSEAESIFYAEWKICPLCFYPMIWIQSPATIILIPLLQTVEFQVLGMINIQTH